MEDLYYQSFQPSEFDLSQTRQEFGSSDCTARSCIPASEDPQMGGGGSGLCYLPY